jgi:hypothetical protein
MLAEVPLTDASILSAALVQAFPMPVLLSVTVRLDLVWMLLFSSEGAGAIKLMRFCRMAFWIVSIFINNSSAICGSVSPWLYFTCI